MLESRLEPVPEDQGNVLTANPAQEITYKGRRYTLKRGISTLLVIGLDEFGPTYKHESYRNDQQADFIVILVFNDTDKTCSLIHLNRDTMTDVTVLSIGGKNAGVVTEQLALAHTYGSALQDSCRNTKKAVCDLLGGVPIDHYVSVTMDAVFLLNDLVGGVEVTIEDDFSDTDNTLVKGEKVKLMGQQALTFVRSRSSMEDDSNVARMKRQKAYMASFVDSLRNTLEKDEDFSLRAFEDISEYMVTDTTVNVLSDMVEKAAEYEIGEVLSPEGEAVDGEKFIEFYVDEDSLMEIVIQQFYTLE